MADVYRDTEDDILVSQSRIKRDVTNNSFIKGLQTA